MHFGTRILAALSFAAATFAGGSALAASGQATADVHVRAGPGTSYAIRDVLSRGERVNVDRCTGGWCRIEHRGPDGWVSSNYLRVYDGRTRRPSRSDNPDVGFCIDAPNFKFGINCNDRDWRAPNRGHERPAARVCFYEHYNYKGDSFCARPGESDRRLRGKWNDRISSIRVRGGATATVCENWNFRGRCARVTSNIRAIGGKNNDAISSYRVRR